MVVTYSPCVERTLYLAGLQAVVGNGEIITTGRPIIRLHPVTAPTDVIRQTHVCVACSQSTKISPQT